MLFMIHGIDKPGSGDLREANRKKHRNYLAKFKANVLCAGPTIGEDGETKTGTIIMVDLEDRERVDGFLANDPHVKAGLFETLTVQQWRKIDHGDV